MPKFKVVIIRRIETVERGYHYIEADTAEAAETWASGIDDPETMEALEESMPGWSCVAHKLPDNTTIECIKPKE
jgi:hypothetical protein